MQQILCVAFSQMHEWDSQNVVMTGSTDGVARVSKMRWNISEFLGSAYLIQT